MPDSVMDSTELLKYAIENDIIDITLVQKKIEMEKKEKILQKHIYSVWQGANGYWYTYLPDRRCGRVQKRRCTKEEIQNLIIDYWKKEEDNPTVKDIFDECFERKLSLGKICQSTYLRNTQIFNRHFGSMQNRKIKYIEPVEWEDFLEHQIADHNLTAKAFCNLKGITRAMLKRAKKLKLIDFNVGELFDEMDVSDSDFRMVRKEDCQEVFMEDELPIMLEYLKSHIDIWNLGILVMIVTGIRVGELVALSKDDYSDNPCGFYVRKTETRYKENGKYVYSLKNAPKTQAGFRLALIPGSYSWIYRELLKCNPFGEYFFMRNGERMNTNMIRKRMEKVCVKLGLPNKSPHKARKTYGSILLDNNIDKNFVIGQMGHTDVLTTERHYHKNRKTAETKAKMLSDIPEFAVN